MRSWQGPEESLVFKPGTCAHSDAPRLAPALRIERSGDVFVWGAPVEATVEEGIYTFWKMKELFKKVKEPNPSVEGGCGASLVFPQESGDLEFTSHGQTLLCGKLETDPETIWHALLPLVRNTTNHQ